VPHLEVGIGDDQLHAAQPAGLQGSQGAGPERAVLTVTDGEPKFDLTSRRLRTLSQVLIASSATPPRTVGASSP
jgi:hypothetical protein